MDSYAFRDARRELLSNTLAEIDVFMPLDASLRPALEEELAALERDDWPVADRTYRAVGADFVWAALFNLKALVDDDPVLLASGSTSRLTDAQALGIANLAKLPGGPHADFLERVLEVIENDEAVFAELLIAGHRRWLALPPAERPYPFEDVGVLLPLRLETLFDPPGTANNPDPERWQLLLRVTPDEVSIRRDNAFVSEEEQAALLAFWQAVRQPDFDPGEWWLDGDAAAIAWQQLSDRVRPERAAWLVGEIPVRLQGDGLALELPADMPAGPQPNRAGGLPPELQVFAATRVFIDGSFDHFIGRLPMDEDARIQPDALALQLPQGLDEKRDAWWASWDKAKAVGLGGEWLLPEGMTPETLRALYVVGIGDETPEAHFRAQVDAGEMSVLRLGMPTNSVSGAETAAGGEPAGWRAVARERMLRRLAPLPGPMPGVGGNLEQFLLGPAGRLPFFPGANGGDEAQDSQLMARALWPALWGHWLRDLWQTGDDAYRAGVWMFENLFPEGSLPPLRIDDQPYGLLPATALSRWEMGPTVTPEEARQAEIESRMADALLRLRNQWVDAVRAGNSVVGKSSAEFVEILGRDAVSRGYIERRFLPAWIVPDLYGWNDEQRQTFSIALEEAHSAEIEVFGRVPDPLYLSNSYPRPVRLPLVEPTRMITRENGERLLLEEFLRLLYLWGPFDNPASYDLAIMFQEHVLDALPDSLLLRLLFHACQLTVFWQETQTGSEPEQRVWADQRRAALAIGRMFDDPAWLSEWPNPFQPDPNLPRHRLPTVTIPPERLRALERALRATLDSAAQRIDPMISGFAWQRLQRNSRSWRGAYRLGAYGWLDGPFLGAPGPTAAGRLHTPSYNQTMAALVLRDKFLSSQRTALANRAGDNPWQMDITSSKARLAEELADEVRMGFHIHEILGRRVENIIGAHQTIKELRISDAYAMFPERKDPNEVCNGESALRGLLAGDPAFPLTADQQRRLRHLSDALDTYGDLLMADGVMQLVNREIDRAAATMDAAAGFTRPPSFDFLRTPPSGYQLESVVVSALPFVSVDDLDPSANPGRLADPSVAAFLEARLGNAWTWTAFNGDNADPLGSVTPAELGLTPIDLLALPDDFLCDLARSKLGIPLVFISEGKNRLWSAVDALGNPLGSVTLVQLDLLPDKAPGLDTSALHKKVRDKLGAPPEAVVVEETMADPRLWIARDEANKLLGMADPTLLPPIPLEELFAPAPPEGSEQAVAELHRRVRRALALPRVIIDAPAEYDLARRLVGTLGSRPAAGRDLLESPAAPLAGDAAARAALEAGIYGDLRNRYVKLYAAAGQMIDGLNGVGDDEAIAAALRRGLAWGLAPATESADRNALLASVWGAEAPAVATPLAALAQKAAAELEARRKAAPDPATLPTVEAIGQPLPDNAAANLPDGVSTLARALANLASPDGWLAILARWPREELVAGVMLVTAEIAPRLDEEWLTVVAAPRANLARLEALQLELEPPLAAWSSRPEDAWQTSVVQENLALRRSGVTEIKMPRFAAAYGPAGVWQSATVAVGLIDAFSEAIPMPERSTMTAFGFNAPAARAPQAILLAVPPASRRRLDAELLRMIVAETRDLAHARTARVEDLGPQQALVPTMWLRANGPLRARLRPYPLTGDM